MSKYDQWYAAITENAKIRTISSYTESHHIIPRSLGGTDGQDNLVELTAREHFICHWLLTKTTAGKDRYKMLNALRMMRAEKKGQQRYKTKITSRVYANLKEEYAQLQSVKLKGEGNGFYGKHHSTEARVRISAANKGENNGAKKPGVGKKISDAKTGVKRAPFSESHLANLKATRQGERNGMYGKTLSEDSRKKIGDKIRGRKQTEEEKEQRRQSLLKLKLKKPKKHCPHCGKEIAVNGYTRWHGDNCKSK